MAAEVERVDMKAVQKLEEGIDVLPGVQLAAERLAETEEVEQIGHHDSAPAAEERGESEEGDPEGAEAVQENDRRLGRAGGGVVVVEATVARALITGVEPCETERVRERVLREALRRGERGGGGGDRGRAGIRRHLRREVREIAHRVNGRFEHGAAGQAQEIT
jgi:hypothetical protein